jgi:hypothetical protein
MDAENPDNAARQPRNPGKWMMRYASIFDRSVIFGNLLVRKKQRWEEN